VLQDAAPVLHADRNAGQNDRHLDRDPLGERDVLEIEVEDVAPHRIALDLADERLAVARAVAVDLEIDDDVRALRPHDDFLELLQPDGENDRILPAAVIDGRDAPRLTELARDALADSAPARALQCVHGHGAATSVTVSNEQRAQRFFVVDPADRLAEQLRH
jgi:hypothetical protein